MRKCFEVMVQGLRLRGVAHLPASEAAAAAAGLDGLGVVLLHPGFLPRSAQGDTAVALSDALARLGIMAARIDMPGLGDSEGDLPEDSFTFIDLVQKGGLAAVANECVEQTRNELGLQQVVIGGFCGGAITGFYSLALRQNRWVAGLVALDPIFYLVRQANAQAPGTPAAAAGADWSMRRELLRNEVRVALLNSRLGRPLQKTAQQIRSFIKKAAPKPTSAAPVLPGNGQAATATQLPSETNFKLMQCIEQVLAVKLPVLFVTAEDPNKSAGYDYLSYLLARQPGRATHERIAGTDHGFVSGNGKSRMIECVSNWITRELGHAASTRSRTPPAP
ncbi:MAG: alpha/beta fold hydrolase [Limisphaerales bacterium]